MACRDQKHPHASVVQKIKSGRKTANINTVYAHFSMTRPTSKTAIIN